MHMTNQVLKYIIKKQRPQEKTKQWHFGTPNRSLVQIWLPERHLDRILEVHSMGTPSTSARHGRCKWPATRLPFGVPKRQCLTVSCGQRLLYYVLQSHSRPDGRPSKPRFHQPDVLAHITACMPKLYTRAKNSRMFFKKESRHKN